MLRRLVDDREIRNTLLITLAALLAFWRIFGNFFIAVDFAFLRRASTGGLLTLDRFNQSFYRPVEDLIWAAVFPVFGRQPELYYAFSLAVHVLNGYFVLKLGQRIFKDRMLALCSAMFFVTFSVANEAVFWISASLNEGIYTFFLLSSLLLFIKFIDGGLRRYFGASLLLYMVSILSKESAVVGPLLIFLTGWLYRKPLRNLLWRTVPYAVIVLTFGIVRSSPWLAGEYATQGLYKVGPHIAVNMVAYLASLATLGVLTTLVRFEGNYQLVVELSRTLRPFAWLIALGLLPLILILLRSASRPTKYSIVWTVIALLPYSPLVYLQIRYMYAASIGLAFFLSSELLPSKTVGINLKQFRVRLRVLAIIAVICLGILSNNIGSAYYAKLGSAYQNILQDIRPPEGKFPEGSVLIFVDLPRVTSGNMLPTVEAAVQVYYGQSLTVVGVDSAGLRDALAKYQGRLVFVFKFDQSTYHVTRILP